MFQTGRSKQEPKKKVSLKEQLDRGESFRHVTRKEKSENVVIAGKVEGKRNREEQGCLASSASGSILV